jgi:hypothetical protein
MLHTPPWLFILARRIDAWDKASQALHDGRAPACAAMSSTTWSASPRRSKPGAGDTPVSPQGRCRGGVPDRATFKPTSGAMVAALRWSSRALHFCVRSAYPAASIKTLNFSSGTVSLPPLSFAPRIQNVRFWILEEHHELRRSNPASATGFEAEGSDAWRQQRSVWSIT